MGISENIKEIRRRFSLTQQQLGEIAGVSDKAVSTWESGLAEPRMGAIQKIADHFNISMSEIVDDLPAAARYSSDEKRLVDLYRSLNSAGKSQLLGQALLLSESTRYTEYDAADGVG